MMSAALLSLFLLSGEPVARPMGAEAGVPLLVKRRSSSARRRVVAGALVAGAVLGGGAPYVDRRACRVVLMWLPSDRFGTNYDLQTVMRCVNGLVMRLD